VAGGGRGVRRGPSPRTMVSPRCGPRRGRPRGRRGEARHRQRQPRHQAVRGGADREEHGQGARRVQRRLRRARRLRPQATTPRRDRIEQLRGIYAEDGRITHAGRSSGDDPRRRGRHHRPGEPAVELRHLRVLPRASAILFVFGIFFFVFREARRSSSAAFSLREFLFSTSGIPTSESHVRYGVLALIAGTASVTALAMAIAVPFGSAPPSSSPSSAAPARSETLKIVIELLAAIPSWSGASSASP
jgi:hypothetical protein